MNIVAAPAQPATPVADGSVTAAGQADVPTGFDALLALVDAAVDGAPSAADTATADPAVGDKAEPAPVQTTDPMLAALAALMIPASPPAETTVETAPEAAPAAVMPVQAEAIATTTALPASEAAPAGAAPVAVDAAPVDGAAPVTLAAATPTPPPATPPAAAPAATPAPAAAKDPAKNEAPPPRQAGAPGAEPSAKPAAEAVETQTAGAVAAVAAGAEKSAPGQGMAQADTAAAGAPVATSAASTPTPVRTADMLAPAAEAAPVVRGSPETVAKLSADILKKLDGRSTRFEIALDPLGLGRVDVKMEIGAHGQVTASLSFDTAHAAAELRGRASELRHTLQQAGFDLPESALSFDVNSQAGGEGRGAQTAWDFEGRGQGRNAFAGHAFEAVLNGGESLLSNLSTRHGAPRADGVDIRI